jgi:hypothetical protein
VLKKDFQKFFEKWLGKILPIPLILFALDSSLPFSLRASLVRAGPRLSFTVQTFGLLAPARTLWWLSTVSVETLALSFSKLEWRYTPFNATGQPGVAAIQT